MAKKRHGKRGNLKLNHSFRQCINVAKTEYVKWICNPKMMIFLVMMVFIYDMVIKKMVQAAGELHTEIMVLEPFVAVSNSAVLLFIIPGVYLSFMGDFPQIDGNTMFYIQRTGKRNWLFGQFLFSVMASVTFVCATLLGTCVCVVLRCSFQNRWSLVATQYVKYYPERSDSMIANFITGRMYNNLKPVEATLLSVFMMTLYMVLISMMLLTGFAIGKRTINIGVIGIIICLGSAYALSESSARWIYPTAHTLMWLHFDLIYQRQVFPVIYSVGYMVVLIIFLLAVDYLFLDSYDFSKV